LTQLVPVMPSREYRFDYVYQTNGLADPSGIRWSIRDHYAESTIYEGDPLPASEEYSPSTVTLRTGPNTRLLRIELHYRRYPGTTRQRGVFLFRELALDPTSGTQPAPAAQAVYSGGELP
jgi:hypothetical protein